jgi:hypothetical protein
MGASYNALGPPPGEKQYGGKIEAMRRLSGARSQVASHNRPVLGCGDPTWLSAGRGDPAT